MHYLNAQPKATVWAALSAGGIKNLCLPDEAIVRTIIIAADHDSAVIKAAIQDWDNGQACFAWLIHQINHLCQEQS